MTVFLKELDMCLVLPHAITCCDMPCCAMQTPYPIFRALSIILTKRCEFCLKNRVRVPKTDFRVFAHDACFEKHLR